ncbi:MAG: type II secretion system minor pseudopilin GspJ [Halioglobus sp.]
MNSQRGFTLIEVLIALAITGFVAAAAYTALSTVISGVESTRSTAQRTYEINRAFMVISRDLRQFVYRPVRDEFGETEPALSGGIASRFLLSFTRAGWHNPNDLPRSNLQRVNYLWEDDTLWRESYPVLDRSGDTQATRVRLLDDVAAVSLSFLDATASLRLGRGTDIETRNWPENWIVDTSRPGELPSPPAAIELTIELDDLGELRRLYTLPVGS